MAKYLFKSAVLSFVITIIGGLAIAASSATAINYKPLARRIFERVTGVKIPANDKRILTMTHLLEEGRPNAAIQIALKDPAFTNVRARNFALQLSNKANSLNVNLDDMSALITGIIRDDADFREILTADYHYELRNGHAYGNRYNLTLENAFAEAEGLYLIGEGSSNSDRRLPSLHEGLEKVSGVLVPVSYNSGKIKKIINNNGRGAESDRAKATDDTAIKTEAHPDPAGVFTTRGFASTQYSGGTNRRPVEFAVKNFLCSSMGEIANNMASDAYVGKDVSRFPGGNHQTYLNSCKSCHTVMDSFRGAFAKSDFKQLTAQFNESAGLFHGDMGVKYFNEATIWADTYLKLKPQINELASATFGQSTQLLNAAQSQAENDFSLLTLNNADGAPATFKERVAWEKIVLKHKLYLPQVMKSVATNFLATNTSCASDTFNKLSNPVDSIKDSLSNYSADPTSTSTNKYKCINGYYKKLMEFVSQETDPNWSEWKKYNLRLVYLNNKSVYQLALTKAKRAYDAQLTLDYLTSLTMIVTDSNKSWSLAKKAYDAALPADQSAALTAVNQAKDYLALFVDSVPASPIVSGQLVAETDKKPVSTPQLTLKKSYLNIRPALNYFIYMSEYLIPEAIEEKKNADTSLASFDFINDYKTNAENSVIAKYILSKFQANSASVELITAMKHFFKSNNAELLESDRFFVRNDRRNYLESVDQWIYNVTAGVSKSTGVISKMNNGSYPQGFEVVDDSFVNLSSENYGWRGPYKSGGRGLGQFGQMISQSTAFSSCMAKKIFKEVCYKNLSDDPKELKKWGARFESLGYKVRSLVGEMVISPSCGLVEGGGQ